MIKVRERLDETAFIDRPGRQPVHVLTPPLTDGSHLTTIEPLSQAVRVSQEMVSGTGCGLQQRNEDANNKMLGDIGLLLARASVVLEQYALWKRGMTLTPHCRSTTLL